MSAYALLYGKFAPQGWTDATKLELCMEFIDQFHIGGSFNDFLVDKVHNVYFDGLDGEADEEEIS